MKKLSKKLLIVLKLLAQDNITLKILTYKFQNINYHRFIRIRKILSLTIYAEGQRRYACKLIIICGQFLNMMEKPDVDLLKVYLLQYQLIKKLHPKTHDQLLELLQKYTTISEFYLQELANHIHQKLKRN